MFYLISLFFLETVCFEPGKKYPRIVVDDYEYQVNNRTETKNAWRCILYRKKGCMARLTTYGNVVELKDREHNHPPTAFGFLRDPCRQYRYMIVRRPKKATINLSIYLSFQIY